MDLTSLPPQVLQSFLMVVLASVVLGVILSFTASKKALSRQKEQESKKFEVGEKFFPYVFQEISKLPISPRQKAKTAEAITEILDQQLEKKLDASIQEVKGSYEKIVAEKEKVLKVKEEQYKTVAEKYDLLHHDHKKLGVEKKQTESIVRSMADGLIVINQEGKVLLMNPAAEKLLGVNKEEKMGKSILTDFREEELISLAEEMAGAEEKEIVVKSKSDATKVILRASNAVIENENGQTVGMVSVLSDVTKQKELDELKSTFVANVSHEFRTPLYTIQESLALVSEKSKDSLPADLQRMLFIASSTAQQLTRLVNDLLDFSKIQARQFRLNPRPCRLNDVIQDIISLFDLWTKSKKIELKADLPSEPLEVEADPDRLMQVFSNLISNALKFTPPAGKITVEAKKCAGESAQLSPYVEVRVKDTGPGIPKKDQKRIFEKFVQLDATSTRSVPGTGIGLTIAKDIIELHGGRIWVESEVGKGSSFIVEIPQKAKGL